jgi:hypothetical protein
MQLDSIVMSKKTADGADAGLPDQGMTTIIDLVCTFTRCTFLGAVERLRQRGTAAVVIEFIQAVRLHYGEWPTDTVIGVDGGPEYTILYNLPLCDTLETSPPRGKGVTKRHELA